MDPAVACRRTALVRAGLAQDADLPGAGGRGQRLVQVADVDAQMMAADVGELRWPDPLFGRAVLEQFQVGIRAQPQYRDELPPEEDDYYEDDFIDDRDYDRGYEEEEEKPKKKGFFQRMFEIEDDDDDDYDDDDWEDERPAKKAKGRKR